MVREAPNTNMKTLKTIAIAAAFIVLVSACAAAYMLASFDAARIKQEIAAAVEKQTGRKLAIEGDLALGFWPDVAVTLGRTALSGPGGKGEFAQLGNARIAVAVMPLLSKQLVVKRIEIDGLAVSVIKQKDGTLSIADLMGTPGAAEPKVGAGGTAAAARSVDIAGIRIANARLDWRDEQTGSSASLADLDFSSDALRFADGQGSIDALTLSARGKRDADAFTLNFEAPRLVLAPAGISSEMFKLAATLDGKERKIAAALASPFALDLEKQTVALGKLAGQFDLADPALPMKKLTLPLAGALHADLAKQTASLRLDTKLDASAIKAKVDIGKFAPLALAFDLDIDQLDLDKYLPAEKKAADGGGKIDLSALKGLNLNGTVKIGQLTVAKLKASNVRVRLDARGGRLNIAPLSANLYEGRLDGSLAVDAHGNRFAAKQNLAGVRIGPLLKDLADKDIVEGRGDVALDVAAHGDTVTALKKSLAGTARVALADGAVKGINLGQKLRDVRGMLQGGKDVSVAGDMAQKTDFSEMSASFRIANGVARNDDLNAKSPLLRLAGAGNIDIGNSRPDYLAKASVVATSKGQGGGDLDSLKGLTIPVRLTGPFEKPDWKIELAGLAGEAAKAKVEEKKEALKQKVDDKLKGKLQGLFK